MSRKRPRPPLQILRPPRLACWLLGRFGRYEKEYSIVGDCAEEFGELARHGGRARALFWIWRQALSAAPSNIALHIHFGGAMLKNYLIVAYRNFMRHKLYSFINVFGLAIGLAVCLLICVWVQRELSYDRFHEKAERIYRIEREVFRENLYSRWPIVGAMYKQALIDDFPEIENAVRFYRREFAIKDSRNVVRVQEMFAADNSVFEIFDFGLEEGDPRTALADPGTVVLNRKTALKYFGTGEPLGRSLAFESGGNWVDFRVTGILREIPGNSHIQFDMLVSMSTFPKEAFPDWRSNYLYTYVLVRPGVSKEDLEPKLRTFVKQRLEPHYGDLLRQGRGIDEVLKMHLFPITDIHLHPSVNWEVEPGGSMASVIIFGSIAVLILIIAGINFVNLSTARADRRAREVSLRKTVGAGRTQLRFQFIQESVLMVLVSLVVTLGMASFLGLAFNRIFDENFSLSFLFQLKNVAVLLGMAVIVGILAGLYPAFYLARFEPARVIKAARSSAGTKSLFRRNMVVLQFMISTVLVVGMLAIIKQMRYVQSTSLGFDKENIVVIRGRSRQIARGFDAFRNGLLSSPRVLSVAGSSDIPGEPQYGNGSIDHQPSGATANVVFFEIDYDYLDVYGMRILAGRNFSRDLAAERNGAAVLNEAAAKKMGWTAEEAVGKRLVGGFAEKEVLVVGVVEDFNYKSLREEVEPLAMMLRPEGILTVSVRIRPGDAGEALKDIRRTWERSFPGEQFDFRFLDDYLQRLYERETEMRVLFSVFSALSILVACLGLFGLAAFTAEVRTKEIGIRKTLGATTASIAFLLSREFIKWILLANAAAWPLAWFLTGRWLRNFAYRTEIGWPVFMAAGLAILTVAVLTFISQAIKAASADPVKSMRYE